MNAALGAGFSAGAVGVVRKRPPSMKGLIHKTQAPFGFQEKPEPLIPPPSSLGKFWFCEKTSNLTYFTLKETVFRAD